MERRNFSTQFKQQITRECTETGNASLVARKYDLNANMVHRWIKQVNQAGGKMPLQVSLLLRTLLFDFPPKQIIIQ